MVNKKECKRHKWRVGARVDCIIVKNHNPQIIPTKEVIWCERCGKEIRARLHSDYTLEKIIKKG